MWERRGHVFSLTTVLRIPSHGQRGTTARSPYSSPPQPQPARLLGERRAVQETKKRTKSHTACSTPKRDEGREPSAEDNREPLPGARMRSGDRSHILRGHTLFPCFLAHFENPDPIIQMFILPACLAARDGHMTQLH